MKRFVTVITLLCVLFISGCRSSNKRLIDNMIKKYSDRAIDLRVGDEVIFTTVPFHYYNGHSLPIVEMTSNGIVLLAFDEGKENLLELVKQGIFY